MKGPGVDFAVPALLAGAGDRGHRLLLHVHGPKDVVFAVGGIKGDPLVTAPRVDPSRGTATTSLKNPAILVGEGIADPSGVVMRMGRFNPAAGVTIFDEQGHFGNNVSGLSLVVKDGKVYWANDSVSSPRILTPTEIAQVKVSLKEAFPNAAIEKVTNISDALKK